jgi:uncharacterized repeat protein (TIGR01451 family)
MRSMLTVLATAVSISLLACGVAAASITLFEPPLFHLGSVNEQSGVGGFPWKSAPLGAIPACVPTPTNGQYDQEVVENTTAPPGEPPGFGSQSLRMSNACASGEFFYQTYSPQELQQVGEARPRKVFLAEFAFMSTKPDRQPGLFLSVSPDSGEGSRMSWVGLEDTEDGIQVTAADTPEVDGEFVDYNLALLEDRKVPHTIRFRVKVNPGPDNDVVRIAVDGRSRGCFTTWENYYRTAPEQAPPPNRNTPATINSLQFRSSVPGPPALAGDGYLFDNVSITPSNGPGPKPCSGEGPGGGEGPPPVDIDKTTQTQFARPGDLVTYRVTVRNRGDAPVRGLRACDRTPRALRFVGARPRLRRAAGRRLCRTIPLLRPGQRTTFRATFRLRTNVTADTVTNGGSVDAPTGSAPSPSPPDSAAVLPEPRRRVLARASATIGVSRAGACGAAVNPRAHAAC